MGRYVENNLNRGEVLVQKAQLNKLRLVMAWVWGILFFWLLLIPLFKAVATTVRYFYSELAVTSKRIVGKRGVFNTHSLDIPLNKVQSVSEGSGFWGKIFNYGTVSIVSAEGKIMFGGIKNSRAFKSVIMNQIEAYEGQRIQDQANQMAWAMSGGIYR